VLIRCEKCTTLYELDDKLLPPQGAPVQCSKCQHVFKAFPGTQPSGEERSPAAAARGGPAPAPEGLVRESGSLAPPRRSATPRPAGGEGAQVTGDAGAPPPSVRTPLPSSSGEPQYTADGRPIRKVPFPTAEVQPPGTRPVLVAPGRSMAGPPRALRWVVPAVVVLIVLVGALVAWRVLGRRADGGGHPPAQGQLQRGEAAPGAPGVPPTGSPAALPRK
jgi:predicted Zn finger-like uncharacterized protein